MKIQQSECVSLLDGLDDVPRDLSEDVKEEKVCVFQKFEAVHKYTACLLSKDLSLHQREALPIIYYLLPYYLILVNYSLVHQSGVTTIFCVPYFKTTITLQNIRKNFIKKE